VRGAEVVYTLNAAELPEDLGRLTGLKRILFGCCKILESLPDSMSQMIALEELNLHGCRSLQSLPDSMSQMVTLKELSLSYCRSLVGTVELRLGVKVIHKPAGLTITYSSEEENAENAAAQKGAVRLEAQVRFQSIDTNGDGTLDALEPSAAMCDPKCNSTLCLL